MYQDDQDKQLNMFIYKNKTLSFGELEQLLKGDRDSSYIIKKNPKKRNRYSEEEVSNLPIHYRQPIELQLFSNLTYQQISMKLNIPLNTVRTRIFNGKNVLDSKKF